MQAQGKSRRMVSHWHALRDAARTACGRRHAATWRACRVSRQAVSARLWPLRPCESECKRKTSLAVWAAHGTRCGTQHARPAAGGTQPHGVAVASRGRPWLLRLAAGRDSVPLAASPMQKRMQRAPNSALSPSMGCSWLAPRDAARTACGRRHAATWHTNGPISEI